MERKKVFKIKKSAVLGSLFLGPLFLGSLLLAVAYLSRVPPYQDEEVLYFQNKLPALSNRSNEFTNQVKIIKKIINLVINSTPPEGSETIYIQNRQPRTAQNVVEAKSTICYDRSWLIETLAEKQGYPARRVFLLANENSNSKPWIFSRNAISHAMSEIYTEKGWVLVENQEIWCGVINETAVSVADIFQNKKILEQIPLKNKNHILYKNFIYYRGLYSRHGQLFEPYVPLPEVRWKDLLWSFD